MTLLVVNGLVVGPGSGTDTVSLYRLGEFDSLFVGRNGLIACTGIGIGVYAPAGGQSVRIEGSVTGAAGLWLGTTGFTAGGSVFVTASGYVSGSATGLVFADNQGSITNFGMIEGKLGVELFCSINSSTTLSNFGQISGQIAGVFGHGGSVEVLNTGSIFGGSLSILGSDEEFGVGDFVRNSGQLIGRVSLQSGDDTYDGRGGSIDGTLSGDRGNDTFRLGAGAEVVDGGDGIDTLDFRSGGAIKVALDGSFANTRTAEDDDYTDIEDVIGSRFGSDVLTGDGAHNTLNGLGGKDTLSGGIGNDTLIGGMGADRVSGGAGNDTFAFSSTTEGGDTVVGFSNSGGDDDTFQIAIFGFNGLFGDGILSDKLFISRADNLAQDDNDRFIFNTTNRTLWYDENGNFAGGLTLLATLTGNAELSAADFLLV